MSYPINYPTPQKANIQIISLEGVSDWVKPQGASFVWFTLIGAGGGGSGNSSNNGGDGGGSGAVTNFMGPAQFIPGVLRISIGAGGLGVPIGSSAAGGNGGATSVIYQINDGTGYTLLTANGGSGGGANGSGGGAGGTASTRNYFSAAGFFQSIAGQAGATGNGGSISPSATTFLSGGAAGADDVSTLAGSVTANYGYTALGGATGNGAAPIRGSSIFMLSPIIVGVGGPSAGSTNATSTSPSPSGNGGTGCGGGGGGRGNVGFSGRGGDGGDGLAVIITW